MRNAKVLREQSLLQSSFLYAHLFNFFCYSHTRERSRTDNSAWVCIGVARPIHTYKAPQVNLFWLIYLRRCSLCSLLSLCNANDLFCIPHFQYLLRYSPALARANCSLTVPLTLRLLWRLKRSIVRLSNLDLNLTTNNLWLPSHNHLNLIVNNTQIHIAMCVYNGCVCVRVNKWVCAALSHAQFTHTTLPLIFFRLSFQRVWKGGWNWKTCISISRKSFSTFVCHLVILVATFCNEPTKFMNHF